VPQPPSFDVPPHSRILTNIIKRTARSNTLLTDTPPKRPSDTQCPLHTPHVLDSPAHPLMQLSSAIKRRLRGTAARLIPRVLKPGDVYRLDRAGCQYCGHLADIVGNAWIIRVICQSLQRMGSGWLSSGLYANTTYLAPARAGSGCHRLHRRQPEPLALPCKRGRDRPPWTLLSGISGPGYTVFRGSMRTAIRGGQDALGFDEDKPPAAFGVYTPSRDRRYAATRVTR